MKSKIIEKGTLVIAVGDNNWWYDTTELDKDMTVKQLVKEIKSCIIEPDCDIPFADTIHIYKAELITDFRKLK
jgi:hypothetical protein